MAAALLDAGIQGALSVVSEALRDAGAKEAAALAEAERWRRAFEAKSKEADALVDQLRDSSRGSDGEAGLPVGTPPRAGTTAPAEGANGMRSSSSESLLAALDSGAVSAHTLGGVSTGAAAAGGESPGWAEDGEDTSTSVDSRHLLEGADVATAAAAAVAAANARKWLVNNRRSSRTSNGGGGSAGGAKGTGSLEREALRRASVEGARTPFQLTFKEGALGMHWHRPPRTALVVVKTRGEEEVERAAEGLLHHLVHVRGMRVYLEPEQLQEVEAKGVLQPGEARTWGSAEAPPMRIPAELAAALDFAVTLGGDGTVLWLTQLFGLAPPPPVLSLSLGSLGFLAPHSGRHAATSVDRVIAGGFRLELRHRLHVRIVRGAAWAAPPGAGLEGGVAGEDDEELEFEVLNEVVVDRGSTPFLTKMDCYCGDTFVTNVQGDGIIISTPTGSTAYNLAAGGSMVHPAVPCILFTPICPHSLSFRPLVFPDDVRLRVELPPDCRGSNFASFDGKSRTELRPGDAVHVHLSNMPVPTVCLAEPSQDWLSAITESLRWNDRMTQKALAPRPAAAGAAH